MLVNAWNKILPIIVVFLAFIDGVLVAQHFNKNQPWSTRAQGILLENHLEQKSSSSGPLATNTSPSSDSTTPLITPVFTSQAPYGIWDTPWSGYAEEACVYMAQLWEQSTELPEPGSIAAALLAIGAWEKQNLGTDQNTSIEQTLRILTEYAQLESFIMENPSKEELQNQLDQNRLLLIPVNGQVLNNPHYGDPGPRYHMILAYAYEAEQFMVHDPGTLRGEGYSYDVENLLSSIQDLDGLSRVLVVAR